MSALIDGNEAYQEIKVLRVDWDQFRGKQISKDLNVRRQSTLVMFNNGEEVERLIAQTSSRAIEQLFLKAVSG